MILAGEASGDAHAAEFVEQLKLQQPGIQLSGMGSQLMRRAGVDVFFDSSCIAVVGLIEVLKHWGDIKKAMVLVKQKLDTTRPDLLVLVDYPEFNLKMARHAQSLGIKVLFYISPQVWAWRPKRIHKIGRLIDHMAVIFKFEEKYYQQANIPVSFVGHPLVDKVKVDIGSDAMRQRLGLTSDERVIGLFPGSRRSELTRLLPLMFDSARTMLAKDSELKFLLPVATSLDFNDIAQQCKTSGLNIIPSQENIYDLIASCDAIVSCSGTVTLEIALLEVPHCIVYKVSWLSYQIMHRLITIPNIGLANIVADKAIVREFLQTNANPEQVSAELFNILDNEGYRNNLKHDLSAIKTNLGKGQGAENMARLIMNLMND